MRLPVVTHGPRRSAVHGVYVPPPANVPGRVARGVHCRRARGAGPTHQTSSWTRSLWRGNRWVRASRDASDVVHAGRLGPNPEHRVGAGSDDSFGGCVHTAHDAPPPCVLCSRLDQATSTSTADQHRRIAGNDVTAALLLRGSGQRMHAHHPPTAAPWHLASALDWFGTPRWLHASCWPDVQRRHRRRRHLQQRHRVPHPPRRR